MATLPRIVTLNLFLFFGWCRVCDKKRRTHWKRTTHKRDPDRAAQPKRADKAITISVHHPNRQQQRTPMAGDGFRHWNEHEMKLWRKN
jgi:hypothetical protein